MNAYRMQSRLEEIQESFKVLYDEVEEKLNECTSDDIKSYRGNVFMARCNPSNYTQMFKSIARLLDVCQIAVKCQLDVVNMDVEKQTEADREFDDEENLREELHRLGICDDARLWKGI